MAPEDITSAPRAGKRSIYNGVHVVLDASKDIQIKTDIQTNGNV